MTPTLAFGPRNQPDCLSVPVNDFLSTIPDGWLTAGDVEAVRTAHDAGAFLLDATNVPLRTLAAKMADTPTDTQIIVYCKSGFRASLSVPVLLVLGSDGVKAFTGSYLAWTEAGEEATTGWDTAAVTTRRGAGRSGPFSCVRIVRACSGG